MRNLEFFTVGYSYLIQILPVLVVSPLYFAGSGLPESLWLPLR
jgi:ABC-type uncharacterized transport system fused permease/ATPase subunit